MRDQYHAADLAVCGREVIHLGHNLVARSGMRDPGGRVRHRGVVVSGRARRVLRFMMDRPSAGAGHIQVFGGGGGDRFHRRSARDAYGVARIFRRRTASGSAWQGMISEIVAASTSTSRGNLRRNATASSPVACRSARAALAWMITPRRRARAGKEREVLLPTAARQRRRRSASPAPAARASSLVDETRPALRLDQQDRHGRHHLGRSVRRKSGGALLGDRIRMNAIEHPTSTCARSRRARPAPRSASAARVIAACQGRGLRLVIVETSGIGQGDAAIVAARRRSLYVMTPEYGAASQLEKIDMIDFADFVAINKFDRKGAGRAARRSEAGRSAIATRSGGPTRCPYSARSRHGSTTRASPRCTRRRGEVGARKGLSGPASSRALREPSTRPRSRDRRGARPLSRRDRGDRAPLSPVGRQGDAHRAVARQLGGEG